MIQTNTFYLNNTILSNLILLFNLNTITKANNKFISDIYINLQRLYISYESISYDDRKSNLQINLLICELFYKFCIMIYTNKIIIDDLNEFYSSISLHTRSSKNKSFSSIYKNNLFIRFYKFINDNKKSEYKKEIDSYQNYILYIFGLFNKDIFDIDININKYLPHDTLMKIEPLPIFIHKYNLKYYTSINFKKELYDNISNYVKCLIKQINNNIYIRVDISYITIPQYEGICWFIAMLNSISYSDMNKNLLISKKESGQTNLFKSYVYEIINKITRDFKQYNQDNIYEDCSLFIDFKYKPLNILGEIIDTEVRSKTEEFYLDLLTNICSKISDTELENENILSSQVFKRINSNNVNDDNWAIGVFIDKILDRNFNFNQILKQDPYIKQRDNNQKKEFIALHIYYNILTPFLTSGLVSRINEYKYDDYGISFNQHHILSYLYNLLNIDNNYYYCYKGSGDNNIFEIRQKKDIILKADPKIIIIENCSINNIKYFNIDESKTGTIKLGEYINMNNKTYKLDYILHLSNDNLTCKSCGHCISAIHYNEIEYVYDSRNSIYRINCATSIDNDIRIPCPLLEQKWTDRINSNSCYMIEKCGVINIKKSHLNSIVKEVHQNICYTYDSDIIYVYVLT